GVEGLVGRAEGVQERLPVLLVLPAVDRQEPAGPNSIAVQLGTQEPRGTAKQLTPGAVGCVGRGERRHTVIRHLVLPHPHEHASIRPGPEPPAPSNPRRAAQRPLRKTRHRRDVAVNRRRVLSLAATCTYPARQNRGVRWSSAWPYVPAYMTASGAGARPTGQTAGGYAVAGAVAVPHERARGHEGSAGSAGAWAGCL